MAKDNEFGVICIKEAKNCHHLFDNIIKVLNNLFVFRCGFIKLLHDITELPGLMHIGHSPPYRGLHKMLFLNDPTLATTNTLQMSNLQRRTELQLVDWGGGHRQTNRRAKRAEMF